MNWKLTINNEYAIVNTIFLITTTAAAAVTITSAITITITTALTTTITFI